MVKPPFRLLAAPTDFRPAWVLLAHTVLGYQRLELLAPAFQAYRATSVPCTQTRIPSEPTWEVT